MTTLSEPNYGVMPLSDKSVTLGTVISINTRHRLCVLCLREIEKNLISTSESDSPKRRGRPQSASTILANRVGVTYDTIRRWADLEKIQSCDVNAEKLARIAHIYNPEETNRILRQDIELRRMVVEDWISQRLTLVETGTTKIIAYAYAKNKEIEEGT